MWARLAVVASPRAEPGRHRRDATFTISGAGGWPEATVIVRVKRARDEADDPPTLVATPE